ncbi:MAG: glycosyltransferase family 2 protein [Candidatus Omnitrophica bacterium]|nr:glycosyltransferase family 2 protein [Candidatus Omnitrophota bacterium]
MDLRCDLILLSWNNLPLTQACLESLVACTATPCRLILVDNGSEPDARAFLASVTPRGAIREVVLLQNERNEGFPRGMNRGLRASRAPYACLLNNDLRFTPGWLEEMLAVAQAHPDVGLVNPASNTFGHRPPKGMSSAEYLARLRRRHGEYSEVGMSIGFCLLIKREVLERVGLLSEEVERAFFEDEDFSLRAQAAGFRCVVAEGAYVHHEEHASVRHVPEREALFARNQRWCDRRWGKRLRIVWPRFQAPAPGSQELQAWLEQLLSWARRRNHVYVLSPLPAAMDAAALFRSAGLHHHSDVHWRPVPARAVRLAAAGQILKRRKKPFDIIVAPDARWASAMGALAWWHRATVVPESDLEQLTTVWKAKSRSPS